MRRRQVAEIYSVYRKNHVPLNGHIVKFLVGKYVKSFAAGDALVAMVRGRAR
jgi:hypothetical protein